MVRRGVGSGERVFGRRFEYRWILTSRHWIVWTKYVLVEIRFVEVRVYVIALGIRIGRGHEESGSLWIRIVQAIAVVPTDVEVVVDELDVREGKSEDVALFLAYGVGESVEVVLVARIP